MGRLADELRELSGEFLDDMEARDLRIAAACEIEAQGRRIEYLEAQVEACSSRNSSDVDRIQDLETALAEAITLIQDWGAYADDYFQEKHDLAGDVARLRAVLTQEEGG